MQRPSNKAWFEKQQCGPLFVYFSVDDYDADDVSVAWWICPDDKDKCDRRALAHSDLGIRGPKDQLDALIDRAMLGAREAAQRIAHDMLAWAAEMNP